MKWRALVALAASLSVAACALASSQPCSSAETPVRIFNARPLIAEGWYEVVFEKVEQCSGLSGTFSSLEWYVVPHQAMKFGDIVYLGLYSPPNRIYLDAKSVLDSKTIGHEILHHLSRLSNEDTAFEKLLAKCGLTRD